MNQHLIIFNTLEGSLWWLEMNMIRQNQTCNLKAWVTQEAVALTVARYSGPHGEKIEGHGCGMEEVSFFEQLWFVGFVAPLSFRDGRHGAFTSRCGQLSLVVRSDLALQTLAPVLSGVCAAVMCLFYFWNVFLYLYTRVVLVVSCLVSHSSEPTFHLKFLHSLIVLCKEVFGPVSLQRIRMWTFCVSGGLEPDLSNLTLPGGLSPAGLMAALGAPAESHGMIR